MPENPSIKYRAFLSYSHADTRETQKVHRSIETFVIDAELVNRETAMGPIPQTLRPVFRDRHDFETGSIFQDQTLVALDASAALIVLCSPSSAQSRAVNEEVRLFRWRHPDRPLIPVMLKGTAETKGREFFPPALRFEIDADGTISDRPQVVLAADIREIGDGYDLAIAKVIARLLGVAPDDIYRRAERQRRRRQHRLIAGLSSVAVMLAGLGIWAEINRREAVAQRKGCGTEPEGGRGFAEEHRQGHLRRVESTAWHTDRDPRQDFERRAPVHRPTARARCRSATATATEDRPLQ